MHSISLILHTLVESLRDQRKLASEEVKKTMNLQNSIDATEQNTLKSNKAVYKNNQNGPLSEYPPVMSILLLIGSLEASFGRCRALILLNRCQTLSEAFLTWNSVISTFQCEINGGIRIAPNIGATLIRQK